MIYTAGRQLGKSSIQGMMMRELNQAFSDLMAKDIMVNRYSIKKSWRDRRGRQMHRIGANDEVRDWLEQEHSQHGVHNPEWWRLGIMINITDRLYTMLVLRFAE